MKSRILMVAILAAVSKGMAARTSRVFGDNMVLQSGRPIPVWGTGEVDETVSVAFGGNTASCRVGADGKWQVVLKAESPAVAPRELTITAASGAQTFKNVRVGDVYIIMGDRHVGWPFWSVGAEIKTDLDRYADTNLCYFISPIQRRASYPLDDLEPPTPHAGFWRSVVNKDRLSSFAYFYARERAVKTKMPVGVIVVTGGAYDRCDARMCSCAEAYAASQNDKGNPQAYDALNPTSEKGLAALKEAAARIQTWADDALALPQGEYPASNMPELPNLEKYGQVTTHYNYQMSPFAKTPIKGAVFYAGYGWGYDPKEAPLAEELKTDMRRVWGDDIAFTIVPVPEKTVMEGDCPSECNKPLEVVRNLDASNK